MTQDETPTSITLAVKLGFKLMADVHYWIVSSYVLKARNQINLYRL